MTATTRRDTIAAATLALAVAGFAAAQNEDWKSQLTGADALYGVHFPSDLTTGYAVGASGLVLETTDGGASWTPSTQGASDLRSVWFPADATTGYATAADGSIKKTTNGGTSWSSTAVAGDALYGIHFPVDATTGYAVGASGTVYVTIDAGATWTPETSNTANELHAVHFPVDDVTGWAVGNGGTILKRTAGSSGDVATGTYTGDGTDGRAIFEVGFQPEVVIIKGDLAEEAVIRTSSMAGDASKPLGSATAIVPNRVQSLDADGFTIGDDADVNQNAVTYHWIAFNEAAGKVDVGSYAGDGSNNRSIAGLGFQPDYMMLFGAGGTKAWQTTSSLPAPKSLPFDAVGSVTNRIKSLDADGFTVSNNAEVNANGTTFHYVAWKSVAGELAVGSYAGNGNDDRSITGAGFRPNFVIVKGDVAEVARHRSDTVAGDASPEFLATANTTNRIQALQTDGFQIGSDDQVNQNTRTYHWIAFGGSTTGTWSASTESVKHLWGLHMVDDTTGWACGEDDTILKTTNGGSTWTTQSTGEGAGFDIYAIRFPSDTSAGYCAGTNGKVFKTTDGGSSWTEQTTPGTDTLRGLWFPSGTILGWAVGDGRRILRPNTPRVVTGTFTGDGNDDNAITGVGFTPDLVIVKGENQNPIAKTAAMSGNGAKRLDGAFTISGNRVKSLDADGFTLGNDAIVNDDGETFYWAAFLARGEMQVGSYTGNGNDDRSIAVGFEPDWVLVMCDQSELAVQRFEGQAGDAALPFSAASASANRIQAFEANGFQVGSDDAVNKIGWTYFWAAAIELTGEIDVGSHTGDGFDDRGITGVGFQPELVILKAAAAELAVMRPAAQTGDASLEFASSAAQSNRIQSLDADGFQVGSHATVNGAATTYHWVAFLKDTLTSSTPKVLRWAEVAP